MHNFLIFFPEYIWTGSDFIPRVSAIFAVLHNETGVCNRNFQFSVFDPKSNQIRNGKKNTYFDDKKKNWDHFINKLSFSARMV